MAGRNRVETEWLVAHTGRWVDEGLITSEEAEAILRVEGERPGRTDEMSARPDRRGRLPLVVELVSYLGVVLVAVSGAFVVSRFWKDLHTGGRLAIGLTMALIGLVGGLIVARVDDPAAQRLGSFLLLAGTAGVGLTAGVAAVALGSHYGGVTALAVGPAVLATSLPLWRNQPRPLQMLSMLAGVATTAVALGSMAHMHPTPTEAAGAVWITAAVLGTLAARDIVRPRLTGLIVAEVACIGATIAISAPHQAAGLVAGSLTAAAAIGAGLALKEVPVVAVGVVGFLQFVVRILTTYVKGTASALAVLVVGLVLVMWAIRGWTGHGHHPAPGT